MPESEGAAGLRCARERGGNLEGAGRLSWVAPMAFSNWSRRHPRADAPRALADRRGLGAPDENHQNLIGGDCRQRGRTSMDILGESTRRVSGCMDKLPTTFKMLAILPSNVRIFGL